MFFRKPYVLDFNMWIQDQESSGFLWHYFQFDVLVDYCFKPPNPLDNV